MINLSSKIKARYAKAIAAFCLLAMFLSVPIFSQSPKTTEKQDTVPEEIVYIIDDYKDKPEFPGGVHAMYKWLGDSITIPPTTVDGVDGVGRIVVEFDITEEGDVVNPQIIRHGWPVLEKEILRVVGAMPKWIPAKRNGKPIKSSYTLPVIFKLAEEVASD